MNIALPSRVKYEVELASRTTFGLGGNAEAFALPESISELSSLLKTAEREGVPVFILGRGSNVLFRDGGFPGLVIKLGQGMAGIEVTEISEKSGVIQAGAAASLSELIALAAKNGLTGLEFLAGIPGLVGGSLAMNAGAFGGEITDALIELETVDKEGKVQKLKKADLTPSYRSLNLEAGRVIIGASFHLNRVNPNEVKRKIDKFMSIREEKQPKGFRSAGSIFKNPKNEAAGKLIDKAGLKGKKSGGASVSEAHANFIVNDGSAKAKDVINLIEEVIDEVERLSGVELVPEIKIVGVDSKGE